MVAKCQICVWASNYFSSDSASRRRCHIKQSERENDQIAILELIDLAVICTRPMRANILNVTEPVAAVVTGDRMECSIMGVGRMVVKVV